MFEGFQKKTLFVGQNLKLKNQINEKKTVNQNKKLKIENKKRKIKKKN